MNTTAFCKEAFDLMDIAVGDFREREHQKMIAKNKADETKRKSKKGKK